MPTRKPPPAAAAWAQSGYGVARISASKNSRPRSARRNHSSIVVSVRVFWLIRLRRSSGVDRQSQRHQPGRLLRPGLGREGAFRGHHQDVPRLQRFGSLQLAPFLQVVVYDVVSPAIRQNNWMRRAPPAPGNPD